MERNQSCRDNWADTLIMSGASGSGKDTVIREVCSRTEGVQLVVSVTTREKGRKKDGTMEQEGVDYFFVDQAEFERRIENGEFLEWKNVHGCLYGTPLTQVLNLRAQGLRTIILNIDPEGAMQVKREHPEVTTVFILPPKKEELIRRLVDRGRDPMEKIKTRVQEAEAQLARADEYDFVILNDRLEDAVQAVTHIVATLPNRTPNQKALINRIRADFQNN